jgi:lipoprotein-anchoring transpeptidase ErfK/SrfK
MTRLAALLAAFVLQQVPPVGNINVPPGLGIQVALDRSGFSPGAIDGRVGSHTKRALAAYERVHGKPAVPFEPAMTTYTITAQDVSGPFADAIPSDLVEQAKLPALAYTSVVELLAERFHTTPTLLRQLNSGVQFVEGTTIQVPNVEPLVIPIEPPEWHDPKGQAPRKRETAGTSGRGAADPARARAAAVVTVTGSTSSLTVADPSGRVLLYAPVTTGSEHDPLPIGEWKVTGLHFSPKFHYNPELFWDADPAHSKAVLPPGPNNPVGLVWIDISKPHYGIHGSPEPTAIGRSESHGCVRLTNWDAMKLAGFVAPGTKVVFER